MFDLFESGLFYYLINFPQALNSNRQNDFHFKVGLHMPVSFFSPLQSIHKKYRQVFFLLRHIILVLNICIGAD